MTQHPAKYARCATCRELRWTDSPHECAPVWVIRADRHGDYPEGDRVHARDAEAAAEKWGEQQDFESTEELLGGTVLLIRREGEPKEDESRWELSAEATLVFYATRSMQ